MYDVAIIGAGVIGSLIARELSRYDLSAVLLEKDNDVANGTSKANSGIIHAGYDTFPGTNKARFNAGGNPLFDVLCEELDVLFERIGSLVVAFSSEERSVVDGLYERGKKNGIRKIRIVEKEDLLEMEPNINDDAVCALYAPQAGILDGWEITIAAAENAIENGVDLRLNFPVRDIEHRSNGYRIIGHDSELTARAVVNSAGLYADEIHNMVAPPSFSITPRRGQYYVLDKTAGDFVSNVVFQCPSEAGKGVLLAPTVHGNLIVGPDAEEVENKTELDTSSERLDYIRRNASRISNSIPFDSVIRSFAGLRATPDTKDFIIGEVEGADRFIDVAGIESPGLTSAPAIALHVVKLLMKSGGRFERKKKFTPRRKVVRFASLTLEEKGALIRKNPAYGRVICRCENVTEGEIVDAIRRKAGATTIDGVKKRVRSGMGRCQGGFCEAHVMNILSRELGRDITEIVKGEKGSYILTGATKSGDAILSKEGCIGR